MIARYEIPKGRTKEICEAREKIINDFFENRLSVNPAKRIYNASLQEFIYLDYFPFRETARQSARHYKTALALISLTELLELAKATIWSAAPKSEAPPVPFINRITMLYEKPRFGKISLSVGDVATKDNKRKFYLTAII